MFLIYLLPYGYLETLCNNQQIRKAKELACKLTFSVFSLLFEKVVAPVGQEIIVYVVGSFNS